MAQVLRFLFRGTRRRPASVAGRADSASLRTASHERRTASRACLIAALALAAAMLGGCPQQGRVIDPLPDPPIGALLADGSPAVVDTADLSDPPRTEPWRTQPVQPPRPTYPQPWQSPVPAPQPPVRPTGLSYRIVLDPGHGGKDDGTTSVYGLREKHLNLAVAVAVGRLLQQRGQQVWLTRDRDVYVSLEDRARIANNLRVHLFVSIHADSAANASADGFTVYVANSASWRSRSAGKVLADAMKGTGLSSRGVRTANFRVLVQTTCPAALVEMGYLSNRREAALLSQPVFQGRVAENIARGICAYLGVRW